MVYNLKKKNKFLSKLFWPFGQKILRLHNLLQYVCVLRDYQISIMYVYKHEGWVVAAGQYCYINYIIIYYYLIRYTPTGKIFLTRMSKGKKRVYLQHGIFLTITLRVRKLLSVGVVYNICYPFVKRIDLFFDEKW